MITKTVQSTNFDKIFEAAQLPAQMSVRDKYFANVFWAKIVEPEPNQPVPRA